MTGIIKFIGILLVALFLYMAWTTFQEGQKAKAAAVAAVPELADAVVAEAEAIEAQSRAIEKQAEVIGEQSNALVRAMDQIVHGYNQAVDAWKAISMGLCGTLIIVVLIGGAALLIAYGRG